MGIRGAWVSKENEDELIIEQRVAGCRSRTGNNVTVAWAAAFSAPRWSSSSSVTDSLGRHCEKVATIIKTSRSLRAWIRYNFQLKLLLVVFRALNHPPPYCGIVIAWHEEKKKKGSRRRMITITTTRSLKWISFPLVVFLKLLLLLLLLLVVLPWY